MNKITLRRTLRKILGKYTSLTIKKHKPLIIIIIGDNNPSLIREFIYYIISTKNNTRRNLERAESEFSVPLTVMGHLNYPKNNFDWIVFLIRTLLQLSVVKPYTHSLVLELNNIDSGIFSYWIKILAPDFIINTDPKNLNIYELGLESQIIEFSKDDIQKIQEQKIPNNIMKMMKQLEIKKTSIKNQPPAPRFDIKLGINGSTIIDATYYYHPTNFDSLKELINTFEGDKYLITMDETIDDPEFEIHNTINDLHITKNSNVIFYGPKDIYMKAINKLSSEKI